LFGRIKMENFITTKKGYPRWRDSDELVHRTVAKPEDEKTI
jgi:hypothetical protein